MVGGIAQFSLAQWNYTSPLPQFPSFLSEGTETEASFDLSLYSFDLQKRKWTSLSPRQVEFEERINIKAEL